MRLLGTQKRPKSEMEKKMEKRNLTLTTIVLSCIIIAMNAAAV